MKKDNSESGGISTAIPYRTKNFEQEVARHLTHFCHLNSPMSGISLGHLEGLRVKVLQHTTVSEVFTMVEIRH